ncbi:MAG: hypothetical protein C5B50_18770 [Verrucomicrobia bacterium]|nr:MAG: hypothetical protein C5B50_18770 [Verrucomicrobiota bacterium]
MDTLLLCPACQKPLAPGLPLGLCPDCRLKAPPDTIGWAAPAPPVVQRFLPPSIEEIARLFPNLQILELIGRGGMGAVYKARQPALDRLVALKILPPAAASDPGFAERFSREARSLARLNHPNVVVVHDFGQVRGTPLPAASQPSPTPALPHSPSPSLQSLSSLHFLIMEFVDGGNLRHIQNARRLTLDLALAIMPQICDALQFAHSEGIVHRDIKPENILLDKRGRVKIADFGIARMLGGALQTTQLTGTGDVIGTPQYMAPEQIEKPLSVDHRADIYSLGVVFYEMLTGELPLGRFAPPSRKVQLDARLDEIVLHALEKEPALRYQHASQIKTAVESITNPGSPRAVTLTPIPLDQADTLQIDLLANDYVLNIRHCLRRGWALVGADFWRITGISALVLVLIGAATALGEVSRSVGKMTFSTPILGLVLDAPLLGGLYFYLLKRIRGEPVRAETAFAGFSRCPLQLFLAGFVTQVLIGLSLLCFLLPGIYLFIAWRFTLPLVIDKRLEFWTAMRLSRKIISRHWWKFLAFFFVVVAINLAGLLAGLIGLLVTLPVSYAALMYAYEDIVNSNLVDSGRRVTERGL